MICYAKVNEKLKNRILRICHQRWDECGSKQHHFSFLVKNRKIVSVGVNNGFITHPWAAKYGHRFSGVHSEVDVIRKYKGFISDLSNLTLINIRIKNSSREIALAKPCVYCTRLLGDFGIGEVIYSNENGEFEKL